MFMEVWDYCFHSQTLQQSWNASTGLNPRRKYRPDESGREIQARAWFQVFNVCHLVDQAVDYPCDSRSGTANSSACTYNRICEQGSWNYSIPDGQSWKGAYRRRDLRMGYARRLSSTGSKSGRCFAFPRLIPRRNRLPRPGSAPRDGSKRRPSQRASPPPLSGKCGRKTPRRRRSQKSRPSCGR